MAKIENLLVGSTRLAIAFVVSLATAVPAAAGEWAFRPFDQPSMFSADFGTRFWYGRAKTAKDLFDTTGSLLISRLTYGDLNIYTGEAFARFDLNSGWFVKGYVGGGGLWNGSLNDEDFPPVTSPYSSTSSAQRNGSLFYGSVDGGFNFFRGPDFRVGAFVGYHYMNERVTAFGCQQIGSNPSVCGGAGIPDSVRVITQDNNWHSFRVGLDASVEIDRLKLSVDAAWLPYVRLDGSDAHWLRISSTPGDFTGPVPEDGKGWGYQIDGFVSYRVTDILSVGVGGRYWRMQTDGFTHFEGHIVGGGGSPQVVKWKTDNFGVFFQSSVKLGPYPLISGL